MIKLTLNSDPLNEKLKGLADPPHELWGIGLDAKILLRKPCVAVVGTRRPTNYGAMITDKLSEELAMAGVVIVSGLALGLDSIAHRAALRAGGSTIAVLPGPIDRIYPASHQQLASAIQQNGCLISEYPPGSGLPMKYQFIARNRLIAALADVVLIPEAASKSGSLHTAMFALDLGRTVTAVPGPILASSSQGSNQLIKTGAMVITEAQDVLDLLGIKRSSTQIISGATPAQQSIIRQLSKGVQDGSELIRQSGLEPNEFLTALTELEISGKIKPTGAGNWRLA